MKMPNFKYNIGDCFCDDKRQLQIIDKKYIQKQKTKKNVNYTSNQKFYKYKCLKCGNEDWIIEYAIEGKQKIGCNACGSTPKKLVYGVNDITTTAPWMIKYFIGGENEARLHFKYEKKRIDMICPDCGRIHKNKLIETVCNNKRLSCPCQDGWSYPNKFMYSVFEQLGLNFETEKVFDWAKQYQYDAYICHNGLNIVCEYHGIQHYEESALFNNRRSLQAEIANDKTKQEMAMNNGIDVYIVIDCRVSSLDYIKTSILNSDINTIFNICYDDIDWQICDQFALSNLLKFVCDYKNKHNDLTLTEIAENLSLSYGTVLRYVQHGSKYGWCSYSKQESIEKIKYNNARYKPLYCKTLDIYYTNSEEAEKELLMVTGSKYYIQGIQRSARTGKPYKNLLFEYVSS